MVVANTVPGNVADFPAPGWTGSIQTTNNFKVVLADSVDADGTSHDPLDWLQAELGHTSPSSEDTAHWRAAGQQLMHCLDELPHAQRVVFLMHHEDDCSLQELAAALQIAAEAAKSRLRYAMAKLRGCMGRYLDGMQTTGASA